MTRRGRRPQPQMTDATTYPHAYAPLVVVRRYFGVSQRVLNRWHAAGLLVIRDLGSVRRIKVTDIVAFEASTQGTKKAS